MTNTHMPLRGLKVFLSAAVPEELKGQERAQALLTFQARLVSGIVGLGGRLIFGGVPAVTRVVHRSVQEAINEVGGVDLFQLERFRLPDDPIVQDRSVFRSVTWIPRLADGDATIGEELTAMRRMMIGRARAAVFLGGRRQASLGPTAGILQEYELFVEAHPEAPAYLVGLFGGAVADLIGQLHPNDASQLVVCLNSAIQNLTVGDARSLSSALEDVEFLAGKVLADLHRRATASAGLEARVPISVPTPEPQAVAPVLFIYATGIKRPLFTSVRLTGNWDSGGRLSRQFSMIPMTCINGPDGCPTFQVKVAFSNESVGRNFNWGVLVEDAQGRSGWGQPAEVPDIQSTSRWLSFTLRPNTLDGASQEARYTLSHSRRLGAQPYYRPGQAEPGIRFGVWAPNAREVQVVFGSLWDSDDPSHTPTDESLPVGDIGPDGRPHKIAGGYIADDGTGSHPRHGHFPLRREGDEWFTDVNDPALARFADFDHKPYMFRVRRDDGVWVYRTDLYSRCQIGKGTHNPNGAPFYGLTSELDGRCSCSIVVDPNRVSELFEEPVWPPRHFIPEESFWQGEFDPARPVPRRIEDLVIYELHVGALGGPAKESPGDFKDAIALLAYLVDLGVNAVELLPVAECGDGNEAWGYGNSHPFAVQHNAGGRDQLKCFIRDCHRRGIAVILSVVYSHYNHSAERAEWMYDSNAHEKNVYYWYEGKPSDYPEFDRMVPPEPRMIGGYVDNVTTGWAPRYYDEHVRALFISSAVALVEEFHVDGFHVDLADAIHAYNTRHADGAAVPNANIFGAKFLREWARTLKLINPAVLLMAEDYTGGDRVTKSTEAEATEAGSTEAGGLGFDAAWYADFYHHLVGNPNQGHDQAKLLVIAGLGDDRPLALDSFAGALKRSAHKKVVYHISHDEAGNALGSRRTIEAAVNGAPLDDATRRYAEARTRLVAGLALLSAGTPMFLMGEEVAARKPYTYDRWLYNREDLYGERTGDGARMFRFYQEAIRLRLNHIGLRSRRLAVLYVHNINRLIAFRRWEEGADYLVLASFNNRPFVEGYVFPNLNLADGRFAEVFNSDAAVYGGHNVGNAGATLLCRAGRFEASVPANGFVVFERGG
jgi:1,4-alpha-glucan branching enzyme